MNRIWQLQEAKNKLSEVVDERCKTGRSSSHGVASKPRW